MKILSLLDGISIAQQALKELNIPVETYYASEIDKYAISITKKNFPDTIQLGDIRLISYMHNALIAYPLQGFMGDIDLIIGGSPCQDLSIAKKNREGLKGSRSGLFYEFVRLIKEVKPKYFVLENVNSMPKEAKQIITDELWGIEPVMINASLLSAQNRKRLFWTCSRSDLCYNCKYEQLLKEIQHRGKIRTTQKTSVGKLLSEKSKKESEMQDLRNTILSQSINSEMLLSKLYDYQQKTQRQEKQTNRESKEIPESLLQKKEKRIVKLWESLSQEQQEEVSDILSKVFIKTNDKNEKVTERCLEKKQKNYKYDWKRGVVGYVEKNEHGMFVLRFYGGLNSRPYNPHQQGWNKRFGKLTTSLSELQFLQERQTNICSCCGGIIPLTYEQVEIPQPKDKGILLKDILESDVDEKYYVDRDKSHCIDANYYKGGSWDDYIKKGRRQMVRVGSLNSGGQGDRIYSPDGKSVNLSANGGGRGAKTGLYAVPVALRNRGEGKKPEYNGTGKANSMTTVQTDSMVKIINGRRYQRETLDGGELGEYKDVTDEQIRKLTCVECERLQSLPDNFSAKGITDKGEVDISNTQRYKALGNGFNCEVVKHIIKHLILT